MVLKPKYSDAWSVVRSTMSMTECLTDSNCNIKRV